jgi:23S rRNA (cytidine1920-2'-O)/16S rRNA (cytidine1409-2'-O)-methyltransferase
MARRQSKQRQQPLLDLLTGRFLDHSRDELYRLVMCGEVRVNGGTVTEPRRRVATDAQLSIVTRRFVSRGGEKLDAALEEWRLRAEDRIWLDAGASTGGFTDCLLQRGADAVHAVDVGYNQLDYRLRTDRRVFVRERTNIVGLSRQDLQPAPHAAVCDLSFRSLRGVLRSILDLTREGWAVALLKPQFEVAAENRWNRSHDAGALDAGGGVIRGADRTSVIERVCRELADEEGVVVHRTMDSPITGHDGNREVLLLVGVADRISSADLPE